jgi:hypothetical protein
MWTFYGLAEIGALTGNVVRRWHRLTINDREHEESTESGLLARRMSALDIDSETFARLEPALLGNLQTLCRDCEWPERCRHDLRRAPNDVGWEEYCPNATVLNAVAELGRFRKVYRRDAR